MTPHHNFVYFLSMETKHITHTQKRIKAVRSEKIEGYAEITEFGQKRRINQAKKTGDLGTAWATERLVNIKHLCCMERCRRQHELK